MVTAHAYLGGWGITAALQAGADVVICPRVTDASSVITKHPGTGGLVSPGTVTAQLLYEIGPPAYLNPDVTAHFDTIALAPAGPDRVTLAGTRGSPPPDTLKVAVNILGGYRNTMTMVITGHELPNLLALNFVVHGLLAPGVSATTRPDPQAKGLGEYLRSRLVTVPATAVAEDLVRSAKK